MAGPWFQLGLPAASATSGLSFSFRSIDTDRDFTREYLKSGTRLLGA